MKFIVSILFLLFCQNPAEAAFCTESYPVSPVPTPVPTDTRCQMLGDVLYMDGDINGDFLEILAEHPHIRRIELNSPGGDSILARDIAKLVRARGIETHVRQGAVCESACTLVFQGGRARSAHAEAKFMFHGSRLGEKSMKSWAGLCLNSRRDPVRTLNYCAKRLLEEVERTKSETEKLFAAYVELGAKPKFIDALKARSEDDNWFENGNFSKYSDWRLTGAELRALAVNVVQSLD